MHAEVEALAEPSQYLPPAAQEVKKHLDKTIAAGTSPSGKAWKPRKSDGGKPLKNAAAAVDVRVAGTTIVVELTGHHVFHHYPARGNEAREIIPKEIDESLGNAIRRGVVKPFKERSK
jgi:hypothetical protein